MWGNSNWWQQMQAQEMQKQLLEAQNTPQRPNDPTFNSIRGSNGMLQDQYQLGNNLNTDYLDSMRQQALRAPGEASTWRQLQQGQIDRQAGDAQKNVANQQARAMDQMAMRGGVSSGAMSRMANQSVAQGLAAQQNTYGQGLQADMADEQNRLQGLNSLGQQELAAAQFGQNTDKFNIQASLNDIFQERAFDTNMYNEKMRAWASNEVAESTPSSGGKK